jgi:hypothetical protein
VDRKILKLFCPQISQINADRSKSKIDSVSFKLLEFSASSAAICGKKDFKAFFVRKFRRLTQIGQKAKSIPSVLNYLNFLRHLRPSVDRKILKLFLSADFAD